MLIAVSLHCFWAVSFRRLRLISTEFREIPYFLICSKICGLAAMQSLRGPFYKQWQSLCSERTIILLPCSGVCNDIVVLFAAEPYSHESRSCRSYDSLSYKWCPAPDFISSAYNLVIEVPRIEILGTCGTCGGNVDIQVLHQSNLLFSGCMTFEKYSISIGMDRYLSAAT